MANAPFNIGPYQGRAIRLGSSRSLKVYRGSRELGSSDLALTIHDAFSGSGSVAGRTPDTVDNGETWTLQGSTYSVQSGYLYLSANSSAYGTTVINTQSNTFRLEATTQGGASSFRHGLVYMRNIAGAETEKLQLNDANTLLKQYITSGGVLQNTTLATGLGLSSGVDINWVVEVNPSSVSYELSTGGSTIASGTYSPSQTPNYAGFHSRTEDAICSDFKVYTPPVEATRKIVLDFGGIFDGRSGNGAGDGNPVFTKPSTGLSGLLNFNIRSPYGFVFSFNTSADQSSFLASYPSNFGQITYVDTYSNTEMTTQSGWSWTIWNVFGEYRCYINSTSINNFFVPSDGSPLIGESYTLIGF